MSRPIPEPGDVYIVDYGQPIGHEQGMRRPSVVISPIAYNSTPSALAVVLPITTRDRGIRFHHRLDHAAAGLDRTSVVRTEDICAVSHLRLRRRLGEVTREDLRTLRQMVRDNLDL